VLGHIGRVVCRQAAENLTPLFQPVTDRSGTWRGRKKTHQIDRDIRFSHDIVNVFMSGVVLRENVRLEKKIIISHNNPDFVLTRIYLITKPLLFRGFCSCVSGGLFCTEIDSRTPGCRVHKFTLVICFSSDQVT
jgi:hypothetical protein